MRDFNQLGIVGRLTRDAELRYTPSGMCLCTFAIAVNRRIKKGEQWQDEANFFDLTLWGKTAENLHRFLTKGQQVLVEGELRQERWEKDGQKHSKVQISVENIHLIGGRKEGSQPPESPPRQAGRDNFDPSQFEDDIPF